MVVMVSLSFVFPPSVRSLSAFLLLPKYNTTHCAVRERAPRARRRRGDESFPKCEDLPDCRQHTCDGIQLYMMVYLSRVEETKTPSAAYAVRRRNPAAPP